MTITALDASAFDWHRGAGGAADVRRVVERAEEHDGRGPLDEAALLTLANRGLSDATVLSADGNGFALLQGLSKGPVTLDLAVGPEARRQGLGRALAEAALDIVPAAPVTAWAHGNHPGATALAKHTGFDAVRELWLMRRPSGARMSVKAPEGYTIRRFRPGADDAGFLAVNAAAFATHPEQGSLDRRGLLERMAEPWFDPAGFFVGERDGRIVGYHWTKMHKDTARRPQCGEVYVIGVDPSAQGSGLGRALLAKGLEHLRRRGAGETILYVEAANAGAVRLYERYGFTHAHVDTDVMYSRG